MERGWLFRFLFLCLCVLFSGAFIYPTIADLDLKKTKFPVKQKINLGLDLQGGLYLVLGIEFNQVYKEVADRRATSFSDRLKDKGISVNGVRVVKQGFPEDDPRVFVDFDSSKREEVYRILKDEYEGLRLTKEDSGHFELGLSSQYRVEVRERTINQSIEVIRNRIDEFGVTEPTISSQGTNRVVVELPGVKEVERAKELIGRTAKLEFKLVDDKGLAPAELASLVSKIEKENQIHFDSDQKFSQYIKKINELAGNKVPQGDEIAFERVRGIDGQVIQRIPYLLKSKTEVTGDDLQDAHVQFDPETRRPMVGFSLNPRGASLFDKLTGDHVQERLAIVLDGIVHSAPVIQNRISGGRGQINLGRGNANEVMKEAKDLAIVLRAGALPAQLNFLEQRVVGPSLGQDSIKKGRLAGLVGVLCVLLFVIFYYRKSGLIAAFSLVLNVLFVFAILVGLEATLTLSGNCGNCLNGGYCG